MSATASAALATTLSTLSSCCCLVRAPTLRGRLAGERRGGGSCGHRSACGRAPDAAPSGGRTCPSTSRARCGRCAAAPATRPSAWSTARSGGRPACRPARRRCGSSQRGLHEVRLRRPGARAPRRPSPACPTCSAAATTPPASTRATRCSRGARPRTPGVRVPRTGRVVEALLPAVLEQKVTGKEAFAAFRTLVLRFGSPRPGRRPRAWRVAARRRDLAARPVVGVAPRRRRPQADAHRARLRAGRRPARGVRRDGAGRRRAAAAGRAGRRAVDVRRGRPARARATPTRVSVGDYHLAAYVGWALLGRPVDDDGMVELLEPWRPHRHRVVLLIGASGFSKPRFGPRMTVQDHRRH